MNELEVGQNMFDSIRHVDENGNEYWLARELMTTLEYIKWQKFKLVIEKAIISCKVSNFNVLDHFTGAGKMIKIANGGQRKIVDYKLSRYACYLIAQNGDARKKVIALAQTYFAVQTRRQELSEKDYNSLSEEEKRFYQRDLTKKGNYSLNQTAMNAGVRDFAKFHNAGYKGLYNGETANDIAKRKGLRYREDILDNMGSTELAANLFRITQTDEKIRNDNIIGENNVNKTHYKMGRDIRKFISKQGGTMPEDLPTPNKSLKELEKNKTIEYNK